MIKTFELETLFFLLSFFSATLAAFVTLSKSVDFISYLLKFLNNLQQFIHSTQCFALGHPVNIVQIFAKNLLDTLWGVIPILLLFVQQITILMLFSFTNSWIQVNSFGYFSYDHFFCLYFSRQLFWPKLFSTRRMKLWIKLLQISFESKFSRGCFSSLTAELKSIQ